jgi:hypothetical protein
MIRGAHASGIENNNFHLANADALRSESNTTLTVLLAAGLGSLAYAADKLSIDKANAVAWGAGVVSMYLLLAAAVLVRQCLSARDIWPSHNEPKALVHEGFTWTQVLEGDIENLEKYITFNRERNKLVGGWLNNIRYAAFLSPLIWFVVWVMARALTEG